MNLHRSIRPAIIALASLALIAPTASATVFPGSSMGSDQQALSVEELVESPFSFITNIPFALAVNDGSEVETPEKTKFCDDFNTRGCNLNSTAELRVQSIIPICGSEVENCIDKLQISKPDGTSVDAKFVRYFKGKTFETPAELGMPGGSRVSLWQAVGANNAGGTDLYAVNTQVIWRYQRGAAFFQSFNASVYAVREKFDPKYKNSGIYVGPAYQGKFASVTETGEILYDGSCVATEPGACAERLEFAEGTRVKLTMKLSNKVTGWLHGRIAKPEIELTPIDSRFNLLSVAANVVDVPMMYASFSQSKMSANFLDRYNNSWNLGRGIFGVSFWRQFPPSSEFASEIVTTLGDSIKNTATEVHTYWNLASPSNPSTNRCLNDSTRLVGFVTTNAMAYSGTAPTWDGESLQYKVAGLHFLPDGKTLTSGTYDLAMRSDTARCLYGFTNAPISASISVTSADGEQKVATTVLNEKNGWLYLAAYGFSFSSPTIKVKFTQEKPSEVAPNPSTSQSTSTFKTIKCVKGKSVKTVKGLKPKCPAGYKAKSALFLASLRPSNEIGLLSSLIDFAPALYD